MVDCIEEEALNAMEKAKTKTRSALLEKTSEKTYKNYVIYTGHEVRIGENRTEVMKWPRPKTESLFM